MNPLEKGAIGNTGISVSRLGLGGAPLSGMVLGGGLYGGTAREAAMAIIKRAHELGISYFDTAPLYGSGRSEARYAGVLPELDRDSFVISSKCGRVLVPEDGPDDAGTTRTRGHDRTHAPRIQCPGQPRGEGSGPQDGVLPFPARPDGAHQRHQRHCEPHHPGLGILVSHRLRRGCAGHLGAMGLPDRALEHEEGLRPWCR